MVMEAKLDMNNKRIINVKNPVNDDNPVNFGYLKRLETFITGTYVSSYIKVTSESTYIIRNNNDDNFFGPHFLDFQIIPYDCLLTNLHCCLSRLNEPYLMKIYLSITKDHNYRTHYRFFSSNNTITQEIPIKI